MWKKGTTYPDKSAFFHAAILRYRTDFQTLGNLIALLASYT
jgi:hypothetical protein